MSTLCVDRIDDDSSFLEQEILLHRYHALSGIKLQLYFYGLPAGTFNVNVYKGADIVHTWSFTAAEAKAAFNVTEEYFWGYLALKGDCFLDEGGYAIDIETEGYTFSESAWIGWVKNWQALDSNTVGTPSDFTAYPYTYKLIEYAPKEF